MRYLSHTLDMTEYGFGPGHGGYASFLAGNERITFVKKKRTELDIAHELEKTDKKVQPDAAKMESTGQESGVPTVSPVLNEISISGISRESARTLGAQNVMPVSMKMKKSGIQMDLTKQITKKK